MGESATITTSRRLPFWAMPVALSFCALAGVFVLLWFKLPTWAPAWVVEHSPWADPIVRAVEDEDGEIVNRASERLVANSTAVIPQLTPLTTHSDYSVRWLVRNVFERVRDDRTIEPLMLAILDTNHFRSREWVDALSAQNPTQVTDRLLSHLVTGRLVEQVLLELAGKLPDERLIPVLVAIMVQPWDGGDEDYHVGGQRETAEMAAEALMNSPCRSAIPSLIDAFTGGNATIRRRVLDGIFAGDWADKLTDDRRLDDRLQSLLLTALDDADRSIRCSAAWHMGRVPVPVLGADARLITMSRSRDAVERSSAIFGLHPNWHGEIASRRIVEALHDEDDGVRLVAIKTLDRIDQPYPTSELLVFLSSPNAEVREAACSELFRVAYHHRADSRLFPAFIKLMEDPVEKVSRRAEQAAGLMASTPATKKIVQEASLRLEDRLAAAKR